MPNLCSHLPRILGPRFERKRGAADEQRRRAVVRVMTGWSDAEMEEARSSRASRRLRAEAVAGYFLRETRFAALLLVLEFSAGAL